MSKFVQVCSTEQVLLLPGINVLITKEKANDFMTQSTIIVYDINIQTDMRKCYQVKQSESVII